MTLYAGAKAAVAALRQVAEHWRYQEVDLAHGFDGMTPGAVDCSGSTKLAAAAGGLTLPHQSAQQAHDTPRVNFRAPGRAVGHVMRFWLKPGDLVFYYTPITHVAMYVGIRMTAKGPRRMIVNATGALQSGEVRGVELIELFRYAKPSGYGFIDHGPGVR